MNLAARLEALAEPGGICISRVVRDQIRGKLPYDFEDMGEQSVKNIARAVRAYALNAVGVASLPSVFTPRRQRSTRQRPKPQPEIPRLSIVVLPFANLSDDPEQQYFADAIADDLTTDLSRISGSFVIARNTAFTYKGRSVDARQIGRELGVRYVLEGSVRRTSDQVRVNVQLIDAETGAHVWADRFEANPANLFDAQSEITGRLARMLGLELLDTVGRRIEQEKLADPNARDLVMRGWAVYNRPYSLASRQEARQFFERALEIDVGSVDARVGIARILAGNLVDGWSSTPQQDMTRAEQLLAEALETNPNLSIAHEAMGMLRRVQNRFAESQIEFETAIALDPNNARAFHHLGQGLMYLGQPEAGIAQIEKAIRLNPQDPNAGHMPSHADEYKALMETTTAFSIAGDLRNPVNFWVPGRLLSLDHCRWFCCTVRHFGGPLWITHAAEGIRSEMSGSPIVTEIGTAIGVVCTAAAPWAGGPNPRLTHNLPGWLLRDPLI